jgi:hypothetical protein
LLVLILAPPIIAKNIINLHPYAYCFFLVVFFVGRLDLSLLISSITLFNVIVAGTLNSTTGKALKLMKDDTIGC